MGGAVSSGRCNAELIDNLVDGSCIRTREVERAFRMVDRAEYFLPRAVANAYKDVAWKTGHFHLSAPCVYSEVMEGLCLKPGNSFLNIGSGTGYLSTMAGLLLGTTGVNHGIEIHEDLVQFSRIKLENFKKYSGALDEFEFSEPHFAVGNGLCLSHGKLGDFREYDRVYCGAACPEEFEAQVWRLVAVGGILVMPCNDQLLQLRRTAGDTWDACPLLGVTFATLVPPLSDVEYTEQERKEHLRIAMTLFTVAPSTLQHLCRSLIRTTLRTNIVQANPHLYKPARKPAPNSKCARRFQRTSTATDTAAVPSASTDEVSLVEEQQAPSTGTQRVTLSLGSNGRLNIDRNGVETEASRRARARLLGQRLINARNSGREESGSEARDQEAVGRCAAVDSGIERAANVAARDVGASGRRALAVAVGNYRVERLLEHLCQEMILEPIADENEQAPDNNQFISVEASSPMEVLRNIEELLDMELVGDRSAPLQNAQSEPSGSMSTEKVAEVNATEQSSNESNILHEEVVIPIIIQISNEDMETDSEKENLTETESVPIELNPTNSQLPTSPVACTCSTTSMVSPYAFDNITSSSNSGLDSSAEPSQMKTNDLSTDETTAEVATNKMDVDGQVETKREDFTAENKKPHHRFAGFRFHNRSTQEGSTSTSNSTPSNKRSSSNSSLKKSSKRRNNRTKSESQTSTSATEDSSSSSTSSSTEDEESDDSTSYINRREYGCPAQILHLHDMTSRLEANNNLGDASTDDDDVDDDSENDSADWTSTGINSLNHSNNADSPRSPFIVRSEYTKYMAERIKQLPLPKKLMVYVNYDRDIDDQDDKSTNDVKE